MTYYGSFFFYAFLVMFLNTSYFSSSEIFDFLIAKFNTYYWILLIFYSNSLFTIIFVIEVLSALIFLILTTSMFSTSFFYKNISFDSKIFFHNSLPYTFLQSFLFYFWVSLISSLNLFVFSILLTNIFFTFDWTILEHVFSHIMNTFSLKEVWVVGFVWFVILFSILLKCGIVPLFLWKPTFFKGVNFNMLAFYILFFYFLLMLFFVNFLAAYFNCIFYYYSTIMIVFVLIGCLCLLLILCESFYLKIFFAVSSILNSLLVFLALVALHNFDFIFFL